MKARPPAGPLCQAWDAPDVGTYWPDCAHGSCWLVALGDAELEAWFLRPGGTP